MAHLHRRAFLNMAGSAALVGSAAVRSRGAQRRPPNFVFVLLDDMGWTDLGCFGSDLYETPHIDRLAAQGVRFTQAYSSCTVCSPSRAAVLTGKYPARLHLTDWIHGHERPHARLAVPDWTHYLPLEEVTIAEALRRAGYATGHVGKWHLGTEAYWPEKHGFDRNIGGCEAGQPPSYFAPYRLPTLPDGPEGEYLTDREGAEACRFIRDSAGGPFFLYLAHYAVHQPLQAKQPMVDYYAAKSTPELRHQNAAYAAMVLSVDDTMGQITALLDELGLAEDTFIFFTSDNGGLLRYSTDNAPLRAGKGSVYEGGVRVPLIVRGPGVSVGAECAEPVQGIDFYPTILELAGVEGDAGHNRAVDGESLMPLLRQPGAPLGREALYWHYPHYHPGGAAPYGAVRVGDLSLTEFYEDGHPELYNLREDLSQTTDLAAQEPGLTDELQGRLHAWRTSVGAQMPTPNPAYDPDLDLP